MARTFGYPIFKTESLEELPFEQYKVLIKLLDQMNKERSDIDKQLDKVSAPTYTNNGMVQNIKKKGRRFRIHNEP